jgi:hypothetical protein
MDDETLVVVDGVPVRSLWLDAEDDRLRLGVEAAKELADAYADGGRSGTPTSTRWREPGGRPC